MTGFANVAGQPNIDDRLAAELEAAGIEVHRLPFLKTGKGEVDTEVLGGLAGWSFKRAWRYWMASGHGIPPVDAERLHAAHGKEVRVEGHCGCPSPTEWCKGFAVGSYHVDTAEGLKALADTIKAIAARGVTAPNVWRQGRRVPRNIYRDEEPICMVADEEIAAEMVAALNASPEMQALTVADELIEALTKERDYINDRRAYWQAEAGKENARAELAEKKLLALTAGHIPKSA